MRMMREVIGKTGVHVLTHPTKGHMHIHKRDPLPVIGRAFSSLPEALRDGGSRTTCISTHPPSP